MPEIKTDVVLSAKTQGLDRATREVLGLNKSAYEGLKKQAAATKEVTKEIQGFEKQLVPLAKRQAELSKEMLNVKKGSDEYKKLGKALSDVSREYNDVARAMRTVAKANDQAFQAQKTLANAEQQARRERQKDQQREQQAAQKLQMEQQRAQQAAQQAARGSFGQGFAQGVGIPSDYLMRGPGMRQQLGGQFAGAGLRRAGQAGWGMSGGALLSGLQGMQAGLAAIPGIGGAMAGQLAASAGFAGQALDFERQQVESMPFVRMGRGSQTARRRLTKFRKDVKSGMQDVPVFPGIDVQYTPEGRLETTEGEPLSQAQQQALMAGNAARYAGRGMGHTTQIPFSARRPGEGAMQWRERIKSRGGQMRTMEAEAAQEAARDPRVQFSQMGQRLGFSPQEVLQQATTMMQRAGGTFTGGRGQTRDVETALAAQRQFGVGADVSGMLLKGTRQGGLIGGRTGADALANALGGAVALRLEGSEINDYLEQIASGINQFQQTGIPFNQDALSAISSVFAEGMTPTRAAKVAGGLGQYIQGIGSRGPTGGFDLMAMQTLGGYEGGGGKGPSLEKSLIALEELGGTIKDKGAGADIGGNTRAFLQAIMQQAGGDLEQQRLFLGGQLRKRGMQMSVKETSILGKRIQGIDLSDKEQQYLRDRPGDTSRVSTPEALIAAAAKQIKDSGKGLKAQADLLNTQLQVGKRMLPIVNNLNKAAIKTNTAFMNLSEKTLTRVSDGLTGLATKLEAATAPGSALDRLINNSIPGMN